MATRIRSYERKDRDAVRSICFETGYLGDPIAPHFDDLACWADMLTTYYTEREPESSFVVDVDGKVVGYLLGTLDARNVPRPDLIAIKHGLLRLLPLRRGTGGFYWRSLYDSVRDAISASAPEMHPDLALYPGHVHFSVLPEARSLPVAPGLFRTFFKYASARGCRGLHGQVFAENERALAMNKALGYEIAGSPWPVVGLRTPEGSRLHVQLLVRRL